MQDTPLPDRIAASFDRLSEASDKLHGVSDLVGKSIETIEEVFQRVNAGVPAWVIVDESRDQYSYWYLKLGYAKLEKKWGIAIRNINGHDAWDEDQIDEWMFNDAPRRLRIQVIDKLPELIDKLTEEANSTTAKLNEKLDAAQQVAAALKAASAAKQKAKAKK